jgi:hypothetical protein
MGQDRPVAGELRAFARIDDLQIRRFGKRPRGVRQGALEGLERTLRGLGHGGFVLEQAAGGGEPGNGGQGEGCEQDRLGG